VEIAVAARAFSYECPVLSSTVIGETNPDEIRTAIRKSILPIAGGDFDQTHPERNLSVFEMSIFECLRKK
jgi:hypothetical protein